MYTFQPSLQQFTNGTKNCGKMCKILNTLTLIFFLKTFIFVLNYLKINHNKKKFENNPESRSINEFRLTHIILNKIRNSSKFCPESRLFGF